MLSSSFSVAKLRQFSTETLTESGAIVRSAFSNEYQQVTDGD